MMGRMTIVGLLLIAFLAGATLWFRQEFIEYQRFEGPTDAIKPVLTLPMSKQSIFLSDITGISGESSPLKFRACFQTDLSDFPSDAVTYDQPTPLIAPRWFDCFDAKQLGADLEVGEARAYLIKEGVAEGVDLVVAFYPDGRGYAWRQVN